MEEILKLATGLGEAILQHPRFMELRRAEGEVLGDQETKTLLENFNKERVRLLKLEREGMPIEPAVKKNLKDLEEKVKESQKLQALLNAQADYSELINKVNEMIFNKLAVKKEEE